MLVKVVKKSILKKIEHIGIAIADSVANFIGTWIFIIIYTAAMGSWIFLHLKGILKIDNSDFVKWSLWLSYFSGIQASIVLISSNRQAYWDRRKHEVSFEIDEQTLITTRSTNEKIIDLINLIDQMESRLDEILLKENKNEDSDSDNDHNNR